MSSRYMQLHEMANVIGWENVDDKVFDLVFDHIYISLLTEDLIDEYGFDRIVRLLHDGIDQLEDHEEDE